MKALYALVLISRIGSTLAIPLAKSADLPDLPSRFSATLRKKFCVFWDILEGVFSIIFTYSKIEMASFISALDTEEPA